MTRSLLRADSATIAKVGAQCPHLRCWRPCYSLLLHWACADQSYWGSIPDETKGGRRKADIVQWHSYGLQRESSLLTSSVTFYQFPDMPSPAISTSHSASSSSFLSSSLFQSKEFFSSPLLSSLNPKKFLPARKSDDNQQDGK